MTEKLLHYIWQFGYYNSSALSTANGEALQILFAGTYNLHQGPDFLDAKIKIGNVILAGSIELHIKTSDWKKHQHTNDENYKNVILHVVWEHDEAAHHLPVLSLQTRVSSLLLDKYQTFMQSAAFIPCGAMISTIKFITWQSWKERILAERLIRKATVVEKNLQQNNYHWEETFWWMLARNFGIKVNADAFEAIARSISINLLAKHKNQLLQLEALLLGQAGLLAENFTDDYPRMLQKEYAFLKKKYQLQPIHQPILFLRMRPGNFPTVRLAQLAALIHQSAHLFSKIKETTTVADLKTMLAVTANDYWHYHYKFDVAGTFKLKQVGSDMIDNIIINTVVPVLFAFGHYQANEVYKEKTLVWLEKMEAETNTITKGFKKVGVQLKNSYDSQALIELKNNYCDQRKCLQCAVGNTLLKNDEKK
ncbi:MAG: hypothetical protein RIR12_177 [Bacteroidota bacterium]|jgi:hypothetical protein